MLSSAKVLFISVLIGILGLGGIIYYSASTNTNLTQTEFKPELLVRPDSNRTSTSPLALTIVEFGDHQCPACFISHYVIKELLKEYDGKINFVYRHFPLAIHNHAQIAAIAAEAAGQQGKYWEMHNLIFENQQNWSRIFDPKPDFINMAKKLGLNVEQFTQALSDKKLEEKITKDRQDGLDLGVNSTPTFYINNKKFTGTLSKKDFVKAIEAELNKTSN